MNLSISDIAWEKVNDQEMYDYMKREGFRGLEIAPTRLIPDQPYNKRDKIRQYSEGLYRKYQIRISSIQSIWFGRNEKIFGSNEERKILFDYTIQAICFSEAAGCQNVVFGCPKNRIVSSVHDNEIAIEFFRRLGEYAWKHNTILALEPNPVIYGTNFINTTQEAFQFIEEVNVPGLKVNLDLGTMIENGEKLDMLTNRVSLINHIHISEPNLMPIKIKTIHKQLKKLLEQEGYDHFISIEMKWCKDIEMVKNVMQSVKEVFN